jgi:tripartite-type tricarboxylate transporter receptor subunit TctC
MSIKPIESLLTRLLYASIVSVTLSLAAQAQTANEPVSFAGKQIKLLIGYSPTGYGYDTYGRLLARHLGKYLPGNPAVVPQNKPGAGSLNLTNYLYNAAPKDGTEIAVVGRGVAMDPLLSGQASGAMFDATKFVWLGSMNNEVSGFYVRQPGPTANLQEILAGAGLRVGATGAGGDQQIMTSALNALLGTKLKMIGGYPGTNEILLAVERGELDGVVGYSWGVARSGSKDLLNAGKLKIVMQLGLDKHKELADIPLITEFVTGSDDRKVLEMIFSRQSMGRPVVAPPGIDMRVAQVLRQAVAEAMKDPQLIAESARMDLEINFVNGDQVQELVDRLYRSPPAVITRAQALAATK